LLDPAAERPPESGICRLNCPRRGRQARPPTISGPTVPLAIFSTHPGVPSSRGNTGRPPAQKPRRSAKRGSSFALARWRGRVPGPPPGWCAVPRPGGRLLGGRATPSNPYFVPRRHENLEQPGSAPPRPKGRVPRFQRRIRAGNRKGFSVPGVRPPSAPLLSAVLARQLRDRGPDPEFVPRGAEFPPSVLVPR